MDRAGVHVTSIASRLGAHVNIRDLDDELVRENADALEEQGIAGVRVAKSSTLELALAVTPGAPGGPPEDAPFQAVVVCTDSTGDTTPTEWLRDYRGEAGLGQARTFFVSGSACANFAAGLDVASGFLASGLAESVLLVVADKVLSGTRFPPISMTVFSDGAASCLVTGEREPGSFRLLGSATENWSDEDRGVGELAHARTILTAMRAATYRATGGPVDGIRRIVTPNFGRSTRQMLAMAVSTPSATPHQGLVSKVGHCFAADIPLNLRDLARSGELSDGDGVLAAASSSNALSAMVFEYQA